MSRQDTVDEAKALIDFLNAKCLDKKAYDGDEQMKIVHRIHHLYDNNKPSTQSPKKLNFTLQSLAKEPASTATPAPTAKTKEPKPIVWLGRGYMGDASENE